MQAALQHIRSAIAFNHAAAAAGGKAPPQGGAYPPRAQQLQAQQQPPQQPPPPQPGGAAGPPQGTTAQAQGKTAATAAAPAPQRADGGATNVARALTQRVVTLALEELKREETQRVVREEVIAPLVKSLMFTTLLPYIALGVGAVVAILFFLAGHSRPVVDAVLHDFFSEAAPPAGGLPAKPQLKAGEPDDVS